MTHHNNTTPELSGIYGFQIRVATLFKNFKSYLPYILIATIGVFIIRLGLQWSWLLSVAIPFVGITLLFS
jgi:hypothetical protein